MPSVGRKETGRRREFRLFATRGHHAFATNNQLSGGKGRLMTEETQIYRSCGGGSQLISLCVRFQVLVPSNRVRAPDCLCDAST